MAAAKSAAAWRVAGYTVLTCVPCGAEGGAGGEGGMQHHCYLKRHSLKRPSKLLPNDRTLFVLNCPIGAALVLRALFEGCGHIEDVRFADDKACLTAHVIFASPKAVDKALAMGASPVELPEPVPTGTARWEQEHRAARPDPAKLQQYVDERVAAFDDSEAKRKAALLSKASSDEWTVVSHGGQNIIKAEEDKSKKKKKKKASELKNFYRFQKLQAKKDELAQLRRRFDEDQQRMSKLKASRKFRPY